MQPSHRPHYTSCHLSVPCLSVRPSICPVWACNLKIKKCKKNWNGIDIPHGISKGSANFQFETSKVKFTGHKNAQNLASIYFTGSSAGGSSAAGADCTPGRRRCKACFTFCAWDPGLPMGWKVAYNVSADISCCTWKSLTVSVISWYYDNSVMERTVSFQM